MAYKPYEESEELKKAQQALQQQLAQKPKDYLSAWESALKQAVESIVNRESFRYDALSDPLYQNYRQQHLRNGRLAMLDTLGQAQSMTGGYGNSYAQSAAQQAYAGQMENLNDRIPELYQLALRQYDLEGQALSHRLETLQQREQSDYSRWQAQQDAWQEKTDLLSSLYSSQRQEEYDRYLSDRDYAYKLSQAQAEQERWQAEFDEAKRQYEASQAAKAAASASKGGGSYSGNQGIDAATVRKAQEFVGTAVDGMWGKNSRAAAKAKGYDSLQAVIAAMGETTASTPTLIFNAEEAVQRLADAGTDRKKLAAYIDRLEADRKITQSQAFQMRARYC